MQTTPEGLSDEPLEGRPSSESSSSDDDFIAYPSALRELNRRLGATADELAAWVFYGPDRGGLTAYVNANELSPPPRFHYQMFLHADDEWDYLGPLMRTWFRRADIAGFEPSERYISGDSLIKRWSGQPGLVPAAYIQAKIDESRLDDLHPIVGVTRANIDEPMFAPLEKGLFKLSFVRAVEAEDFGGVLDEPQRCLPAHRSDGAHHIEGDATNATGRRSPVVGSGSAKLDRDEPPLERSLRLLKRKHELQRAGHRDFLRRIAAEEGGLSTKRVGDLIRKAEALGPFRGLGEELPRRTSSSAKKRKR